MVHFRLRELKHHARRQSARLSQPRHDSAMSNGSATTRRETPDLQNDKGRSQPYDRLRPCYDLRDPTPEVSCSRLPPNLRERPAKPIPGNSWGRAETRITPRTLSSHLKAGSKGLSKDFLVFLRRPDRPLVIRPGKPGGNRGEPRVPVFSLGHKISWTPDLRVGRSLTPRPSRFPIPAIPPPTRGRSKPCGHEDWGTSVGLSHAIRIPGTRLRESRIRLESSGDLDKIRPVWERANVLVPRGSHA